MTKLRTLLILVTFIPLIYIASTMNQEKKVLNCEAVMESKNDNVTIKLIALLTTKNNMLSIYYSGSVYTNDVYQGKITREIKFNVKAEGVYTEFTGVSFNMEDDVKTSTKEINQALPEFLYTLERTYFFILTKVRNGVILQQDSLPVMYCKKL